MKLTPYARVTALSVNKRERRTSAGIVTAASMPCPPAAATAAGSSGCAEANPIGACWIGSGQPAS